MVLFLREGKMVGNQILFYGVDNAVNTCFDNYINNYYDYKRCEYAVNKDLSIFIIYNELYNIDEISKVLNQIIEHNFDNINKNSNILLSLYGLSKNTIYMDMISNTILVIGRDNYNEFFSEVEYIRWSFLDEPCKKLLRKI